ncbi:MAG: hypothetical protein ABGX83_09710 [Nitrospira sp.]|nr:hypothetical protein [Candidatus Manganitrophaceae bacterium]HIL35021.1 hypothetical protein [Candidatus Manganitrophaceae bacterium]
MVRYRKGLQVFIIAGILCTASLAVSGEVVDRIAALVNGEFIFLSDLKRYPLFFEPRRENDPSRGPVRFRQLDHLIHQKILRSEARRFVLEGPTEEEIAVRLEEVRRRFLNERAFQGAMHQTGFDLGALKEELREYLWVERLMEERIKAFIFIRPKAIERYYQDHQKRYFGKKLEAVSSQIRKILADQKEVDKKRAYLTGLRSRAEIEVLLTHSRDQ